MSLTEAQRTTIKADILANQDTADKYAIGDLSSLAELYNAAAAPAFTVWRSVLTAEQARTAITGGDGLAQLDNLTAGKRDSLFWTFDGDTCPANADQRAAIVNLCGTQNTLKAAILAAQKRTASRIEKLFATGTGSDASPAVMAVEGPIGYEIFIGL
jgi:hypothetical protein